MNTFNIFSKLLVTDIVKEIPIFLYTQFTYNLYLKINTHFIHSVYIYFSFNNNHFYLKSKILY